MDDFRRAMRKRVGIGGWLCSCCGPAPKDRAKYRRFARRKLKFALRHSVRKTEMTDSAKVMLEAGEYFAECPHCKVKDRLGMWTVAHLSVCDMQKQCPACGGTVLIERETDVE